MRRRKGTVEIGRTYERTVCDRIGGKHIGGPGKPDIVKSRGPLGILGKTRIDAKAHRAALSKQALQESIYAAEGHHMIESKYGYQDAALRYAHHYHPETKLFYRGKEIRWCPSCEQSFYPDEAALGKCPHCHRLLGLLRRAGIV